LQKKTVTVNSENPLEGDYIGPGPRVMGGSGTNPEPSRTFPEVVKPVNACFDVVNRLTPFKKIPPKS
jgi:hypothetical protein